MFRKAMFVRTLILCGLALTTLAFAKTDKNKTTVTYPSAFAVSQPLSELPIDMSVFANREMPEPRQLPLKSRAPFGPWQEDSVLQKEALPNVGATKGVDFDGIPSQGFAPSDSNLAVGPNHIVETVNVRLAVYNKSGALLSGPTNFGTFFAPLGGNCANGASDPIVLYDRQADRWLISDIGYTGSAPFLECIGVSKTNDPTGAYTLYAYSFSTTLNDYPKLGVWPTASNSAYLATYNLFPPIGAGSADLCGLDRAKMLAGNPNAAQLCQKTPSTEFSYLPSDIDGPTPPTDGTPGLFLTWQNNNPGQLFLRKLTLNFTAGTATLSAATTISVANFTPACFSSCVPQLGTPQLLDVLGDRPMYRFAVRHFADHDRAVVNHSVVNGSQVAVRWYELFDPAGAVTVNQQGTFAPDTTYRWMGSMAEDKLGDIALGYSASSTAIHPAVRFTGRVPSDPLGTLETEASILEGAGSQTSGLSRWGDYTALQVDPSDDCTFWYVDQYEKVNGTFNWSTNIGSFVFNTCTGAPAPIVTLSATKLAFMKTPIGQTSASKSITLSNTGNATLNISSITISGDFIIQTNTCGAQVQAGANCTVTMAFTPTVKAMRKGTLTFNDNAGNSPQTVALTGTGESIALSPNPVNYGTVVVGQSSTMAVTVKNVSTVTVSLTGFTITGAITDYSITANTCGGTIAPGATCSISVKFAPTVKGKRNGQLNVLNNGGGASSPDKLHGVGG